jgi:hypothetical protein
MRARSGASRDMQRDPQEAAQCPAMARRLRSTATRTHWRATAHWPLTSTKTRRPQPRGSRLPGICARHDRAVRCQVGGTRGRRALGTRPDLHVSSGQSSRNGAPGKLVQRSPAARCAIRAVGKGWVIRRQPSPHESYDRPSRELRAIQARTTRPGEPGSLERSGVTPR